MQRRRSAVQAACLGFRESVASRHSSEINTRMAITHAAQQVVSMQMGRSLSAGLCAAGRGFRPPLSTLYETPQIPRQAAASRLARYPGWLPKKLFSGIAGLSFAARSLRAMCGRFSHRYTWAEIHRADGGTNPSINILAASASRSVTSINPAVSAFRRATIYLKPSETGHRGLLGMRPNIIGRNDIQRTIPSRYIGTPLGGVGSDRIVATPFGCLFRIATCGYHLSQSTVERMRHGKRFGATNRHRSETMKSLQRSAAFPHRRLHGRFRLSPPTCGVQITFQGCKVVVRVPQELILCTYREI